MATRIIEGAAVRAAAGRLLIKLREHKARLMLLAVAAGCVVAFASWLDDQLRPALEARERNELSEEVAEEMRATVAPCVPSAGHTRTSWCGAVRTAPPPPRPVTPLPLFAGAPAAFCTANGSPSC
ncbi:hypothetical protein [Paraburkholderia sp. CNPSo 3281]|uniref:hypothetical protein n=1 Tax=Paraburkholderia sp. CNPSo 3281 TaxID=2940933 RepID=UPI0020B89849|nr:hypothetical protein [Paraburkholderia sp. CNPSo 3281]MCP3716798.1 hypothetical protein [Paraburkholderia sp. CNPSo 3281]